MKRLAAMILVFCLLLSGASVAEEALKEQTFLSGLLTLLQSVDLSRDMLTLSAAYEGRTVFSGKLKGQDGVTDLSVSAGETALQAQLSGEEIAASLNGKTAVLRFEDVRALAGAAQAALSGLSPEAENVKALLQLFLQKVILPDTAIAQEPYLRIAYQAPLSTVVKRLADFGDAVFEQDQFDGTLEKLLGLIGPYIGQELPEFAQLKAAWPQIREELLAEEPDNTEAALVLAQEDRGLTLEGHFGNADRMYEASFALTQGDGRFDLTVSCQGDIQVDDHHTVEDIGICLGQAFAEALGDKRGIVRYGSMTLPMDEALILSAVDLSGRSYLAYGLEISTQKVGTFDTELTEEFWLAFTRCAALTLHIQQLAGKNSHHIIEGTFKSVARSLRQAVSIDPAFADEIPSTKGVL